MTNAGVPAAQYLRMSTEHQEYSLENQSAAIARYADEHGFQIVRTYTDAAKSGLVLQHRAGLRQLLKDVVNPSDAGFKAILVYDVSRWGRFQDTDEAAHYEFLCKSAGIPVHYCAETFANDTSLPSLIMKALKRTMAGEYSRELSVKVYEGQKRLAQRGFKSGGNAGFGLRRMLVAADRTPKQPLLRGERKSLQTDRVILVPGPAQEVALVREIYRLLIEDSRTVYGIVRELNRRRIRYVSDVPWDYAAVYNILTHPKYVGCCVYGRSSQKLGGRTIRLPKTQWVVARGAFEPVIDEATFAKAQEILQGRTINLSDEELLDRLRIVLARQGRLSLSLLKTCPEIPSPSIYRRRFGGIRPAYRLIGYGRPEDHAFIDVRQRNQSLREGLIGRLLELFPDEIKVMRRSGRSRIRLRVGNRWLVSVLISRPVRIAGGATGWIVDPVPSECHLRTLLARLNESRDGFYDFHVLPSIDRRGRFQIAEHDVWLTRGRMLRGLDEFCAAIKQATSKYATFFSRDHAMITS